MKKYIIYISTCIILILLAVVFIRSDNKKDNKNEAYLQLRQQSLKAFSVDLPGSLDFAGEQVPLDLFWVHEGLDKELTTNVYWHSSTILMLKRAHRYMQLIEPILKKNGIPDDIKYIAVIESGLSNASSPAGAVGYWQFLKETAKNYGLEISEEVDERYNLEKSTEAACLYLKEGYRKFSSWTLAAASYNAGFGNITTPLSTQNADNFYGVLLNQETTRYIFRILAIKLIFEDPEKYGFFMREKDLYPPIPCHSMVVDSAINNLAGFAALQGINYKILKEFNPWLRKNMLSNKLRKKYSILIPDKDQLYYSRLQEHLVNDSL